MENPTIVFSVGFEYRDAGTAARVANELMTRILNEDLRDRTSRATDTTKFLAREVQRLQVENAALDSKNRAVEAFAREVGSRPHGLTVALNAGSTQGRGGSEECPLFGSASPDPSVETSNRGDGEGGASRSSSSCQLLQVLIPAL